VTQVNLTAHRKSAVMNVTEDDLIGRVILRSRRWYEQDLLEDAYQRLRGSQGVVIDVGAHIGNHTLWFARVCQRPVIAVEPNFESATHLHSHVRMNRLADQVEVYNVALGAGIARGRIEPGPAGNTGMSRVVPDDEGTSAIVPLDSLVELTRWTGVALIKIDVEGSAIAVLEGARETLEHSRPLLYVEGEKDEIQAFLGPKWKCFGKFGRTPTWGFSRSGGVGWGAPSGR
jgi:FkbM family methyltransferase